MQGTKGPEDQRTKGLEDWRTAGPGGPGWSGYVFYPKIWLLIVTGLVPKIVFFGCSWRKTSLGMGSCTNCQCLHYSDKKWNLEPSYFALHFMNSHDNRVLSRFDHLLGTMWIWAAKAERTSLWVFSSCVLLGPIRAKPSLHSTLSCIEENIAAEDQKTRPRICNVKSYSLKSCISHFPRCFLPFMSNFDCRSHSSCVNPTLAAQPGSITNARWTSCILVVVPIHTWRNAKKHWQYNTISPATKNLNTYVITWCALICGMRSTWNLSARLQLCHSCWTPMGHQWILKSQDCWNRPVIQRSD